MANPEHLKILREGKVDWSNWIQKGGVQFDLRGANLNGADLRGAFFNHADLEGADLGDADFSGANLNGSNLRGANLAGAFMHNTILWDVDCTRANLDGAHFVHANLRGADFSEANLMFAWLRYTSLDNATFKGAKMCFADLTGANLNGADLSGADLREADLRQATLVNANLSDANLSRCQIFGISVWNVTLQNTVQTNLVISGEGEPVVTVDDLEVAQFVYLLVHNEKLRNMIDTLTTKSVLILGRFTMERKAVLDAIREELRTRGYIPILFDFEKPASRDLTETVMTLASLSRFIIADLSDPHSIPHELMSFAEKLLSVPVQAIFCPVPEHKWEYPMFEHLRRYPHVLPIFKYESQEQLIGVLSEKVIEPAEKKVGEMRPKPIV